ncbi:MAG: diphosphomevalonate decarboxylase, partial [Bacteroidota bacterium]|nr:diphosphomevalonate decarboxylase [Bacteroidota bacterium]
QGDMPSFIRIVEEEALTLHALMMTSNPSYILMEPQTIEAIRAIRSFREENDVPVCFTLDAGPNIHMLYPASCADQVEPWRDTVLRPLCEGGRIIEDHVGQGPERISF